MFSLFTGGLCLCFDFLKGVWDSKQDISVPTSSPKSTSHPSSIQSLNSEPGICPRPLLLSDTFTGETEVTLPDGVTIA